MPGQGSPAEVVAVRSLIDGLKSDVFAYCARNETLFQRVNSLRWMSLPGPNPNSRFWFGGCALYCQRMTSAPIRSNASSALIALPHEPCISRPRSSRSEEHTSELQSLRHLV